VKKNSDHPLLSIVVPTRNRMQYAIFAIQNILLIQDSRLELVVQDNSDSPDLKSWIKANIKDSRLVYNFTEKPLSFIDNFNSAIEIATGEYICIVGDDDGVIPEIMNAAEYISEKSIDCLSINTVTNYVWPNSGVPSTIFTKTTGGWLTISEFKGRIEKIEVEKELIQFMKNGGSRYLNFNLPKLYHGIVKRECLDFVKTRTGNYFGGLSPDIYISIAIACTARHIAVTDYPLTIPGVCNVSASIVEGLLKKNSKKLEDAPHLRYRGNYNWSKLVPPVYCVETIWADSSIAALSDLGRQDLIQQINLPKLAAHCISNNTGIAREVYKHLQIGLKLNKKNCLKGNIKFIWYILLIIFNYCYDMGKRVLRRIKIMLGRQTTIRIENIDNICDSSAILIKHLQRHNYSFKNQIKKSDIA